MVKMLCRSNQLGIHTVKVDLALFSSKLLIEIADADSKSRVLLCNDGLFSEMNKPIASILSGEIVNDSILLNVAETLSHIVANNDGLQFVLRSNRAILETIASLVTRGLVKTTKEDAKLSMPVLKAFTYVLRQCYRTCKGLNVCESFKLHECLSASWESEEWKLVALDNLLIFSGTPRGLTLLEKSGSMQPCVDYMFQRY